MVRDARALSLRFTVQALHQVPRRFLNGEVALGPILKVSLLRVGPEELQGGRCRDTRGCETAGGALGCSKIFFQRSSFLAGGKSPRVLLAMGKYGPGA